MHAPRKPVPQIPRQDGKLSEQHNELDRSLHAAWGLLGGGVSPAALMLAWSDWALHFATQPGHAAEVALREAAPCAEPLAHDPQLAAPDWAAWPFNLYRDVSETIGRGVRTSFMACAAWIGTTSDWWPWGRASPCARLIDIKPRHAAFRILA